MPADIPRPARRIAYLDALRVLCCFLVIVNHTYDYAGLSSASASVRLGAFVSLFLSKPAVPIFLMISGCTLLTKDDNIPKTLSRFMRIAVTLVVFSFVYEIYHYLTGQIDALSIKRFLLSIYEVNITTAYWYLYAYAGILLMLPFLQKMVRNMEKHDFLFFFAISILFFGIWPMAVEYTPMSAQTELFALPLFGTYIAYMLMGYYLHTYGVKAPPAPVLAAVIAGCALICGAATDRAYAATAGMRYLYLDNIGLLPVIAMSVCLFLLAQKLPLSGRAADMLSLLGRHAFGVYLLSDLFIAALLPLFLLLRAQMPVLLALALYQLAVWACALAVTALLRCVPLIRKLL